MIKAPNLAVQHLALLVNKLVWLGHFFPASFIPVNHKAFLIEHDNIITSDYFKLICIETINQDWISMKEVDKLPSTQLLWLDTVPGLVEEVYAFIL